MDDDELLLINELVDSDDDMTIDTDLIFNEITVPLHSQPLHESSLLEENCNDQERNNKFYFSSDSTSMNDEASKYWKDALLLPKEAFLKSFRISLSHAEQLVVVVANTSVKTSDIFEPLNVPTDVQVLSVLSFLGDETATIEDVCNKYSLSAPSFRQILHRVTAALCALSAKEICLPSAQKKEVTKNFYSQKCGLQGILGCIDNLPLRVIPLQDASLEKIVPQPDNDKFIILQAVVNEDLNFAHIYISDTPDTDHEILLKSSLKLSSLCSDEEYVLGGDSYPCLRHLLTPYPDCEELSGNQIYFNLQLAACIQTIDAAFGLLLQRFRKLADLKLPDIKIASQVVTACCVLHNKASKDDFETINESPISRSVLREQNAKTYVPQYTCKQGLKFRDKVCQILSQ